MMLDSILHPCKLPKKFLMKTFSSLSPKIQDNETKTQIVDLEAAKRETFDPLV